MAYKESSQSVKKKLERDHPLGILNISEKLHDNPAYSLIFKKQRLVMGQSVENFDIFDLMVEIV